MFGTLNTKVVAKSVGYQVEALHSIKFLLFKMCYCYSVLLKSAKFWQISVEFTHYQISWISFYRLERHEEEQCLHLFIVSMTEIVSWHFKATNCLQSLDILNRHTKKTNVNLISNYFNSGWHTRNTLSLYMGVPGLNLSQDTGYSDMFFLSFSLVPPSSTSAMTASLVHISTLYSPWNWQCN